jgi:hypothetical protein
MPPDNDQQSDQQSDQQQSQQQPPPDTGSAATSAAPRTFEVKVDGKTLKVTEDELIQGYGLSQASKRRMEDAKRMRDEAADDVALAATMKRLFAEGDASALEEIGKRFNLPADIVKGAVESMTSAPESAEVPESVKRMEALLPKIEKLLKDQEKADLDSRWNRAFDQAKQAVDNDPVLGKIEGGLGSFAREFVKREVQRRVAVQGETWPDVLTEILAEARDKFSGLHAGNQGAADDEFSPVGAVASAGAGPARSEPIKPVPMTDDSYTKNFVARVTQRLTDLGRAARQQRA